MYGGPVMWLWGFYCTIYLDPVIKDLLHCIVHKIRINTAKSTEKVQFHPPDIENPLYYIRSSSTLLLALVRLTNIIIDLRVHRMLSIDN